MGISGSDSDVTRADIQDVFSQANEPCVPLITDEVAARLDCPAETALGNLTELVELDSVDTKQLDDSTRFWWRRDESEPSGKQPEPAAYSAFVSAVKDYAIFVLDPDGTVGSWNDGAERMREMIEALLEYARVETRGDPFEATALDAVLSDVRDDLQLQIGERDAEIAAESLPSVRGDPGQLRQVFQNLLDNAIEYSGEEPPRIEIGAERTGSMWKVSVSDEGIGIDPAETGRIFEEFQRLHGQEDHAGTGIGLALCRRIIERHGGELRVESEPGEGSTVSFPLLRTGDADE